MAARDHRFSVGTGAQLAPGIAVQVQMASTSSSVVDVLDRVLDKGIVIDAGVRASLVGIDILTVEARVNVASIETHLRDAEVVASSTPWFECPARLPE